MAFEHLELYHRKTLAILKQYCLAEVVAVYHTRLQSYTGPDGADYLYYDCEPALQALAKVSKKPTPVILALVDGPPESTGTHAPYPAVPLLLKHFPDAQIDVILDDYKRPGETEVVNKWLNDLEAMHINYVGVEEGLDRGAFFLSTEAKIKKVGKTSPN